MLQRRESPDSQGYVVLTLQESDAATREWRGGAKRVSLLY
jgi:hypothetical protein